MKEWCDYVKSLGELLTHVHMLKIRSHDRDSFYSSLEELEVKDFLRMSDAQPHILQQTVTTMDNYKQSLLEFGIRNPSLLPVTIQYRSDFSVRSVIEMFKTSRTEHDRVVMNYMLTTIDRLFTPETSWRGILEWSDDGSQPYLMWKAYHVFNTIPAIYTALMGYRSNYEPSRSLIMAVEKLKIADAKKLVDNYGPFYDAVMKHDLGLGYTANQFKKRTVSYASYRIDDPDIDLSRKEYAEAAILVLSVDEMKKFLVFRETHTSVEMRDLFGWTSKGFTDFEYIGQWIDLNFEPEEASDWYERGVFYPDEARKMKDSAPKEWVSSW